MKNQEAPEALTDFEHRHAIRQGHEIAASDGYFEARPQIDSNDRRKVFQAGFERGWDRHAALVEAQQPAAHVQNPAEIEHVAGDVSKNGAESNMAQQPAPSAAAVEHGDGFMEAINEIDELHPFQAAPQPSPTPQADSQPAPVLDYPPLPTTYYLAGGAVRTWDEGQMRAYVDADRAARAPADNGAAPAAGAVAGPALAPSAFVNAAGIKADDKPGTVVRKLDAAFHDAVTFADAAMHGGALWCVNIQGPDDIVAMPSKSAALEHANDLNALFGRHPYEEGDPIMRAVVIEWPHSADSHAADLVIQDATHGAAPTPPAQAADSVLEDAARYRWLRHGDNDEKVLCNGPVAKDYWYLLRGEKLDAAIDAARKQGAKP